MRQGAFSRQPAFDQTGRGGSLQYTAITAAAGISGADRHPFRACKHALPGSG